MAPILVQWLSSGAVICDLFVDRELSVRSWLMRQPIRTVLHNILLVLTASYTLIVLLYPVAIVTDVTWLLIVLPHILGSHVLLPIWPLGTYVRCPYQYLGFYTSVPFTALLSSSISIEEVPLEYLTASRLIPWFKSELTRKHNQPAIAKLMIQIQVQR